MTITALTSCCVDIYPEQNKVYVGGNSLNFASQCILSNVKDVSIIGALGKDKHATLIEQHLDRYKINRDHVYKSEDPTASNKIYIDELGDRYFKADSWHGGAFDTFRLSEKDWEQVAKSDIVAMPGGDPNLKELLKRRHKNQLIAIDFLDYLGIDFIKSHIDAVDIVFLSGKESMLDDLNSLAIKSNKMIVATLGAKGSVAFFNNTKYFQKKAVDIKNIVDTTGCGDAYQAAFTIEWFQSKDMKSAMNKGTLAANRVLTFMGGVE